MLGQLPVERATLFKVGFPKVSVCSEWKAASLHELDEARIVLIALAVERTGEQVLAQVVRQLLCVGQRAVARVELLRQEQESADSVSMLSKVRSVAELVNVPVRLIGPDMLNLVSVWPFGHKLRVLRRLRRLCST